MPTDLTGLANFGFSAIVLGWVLARLEPRLEKLERANLDAAVRQERATDRLSKALLLFLATSPERPEAVKEQARGLLREIERSESESLRGDVRP